MENTPSVADVGEAELGQRIASEVMPAPHLPLSRPLTSSGWGPDKWQRSPLPAPLPTRERLGSLYLAAPPGDEARAALVTHINPQPVDRHAQPVADADQKVDVGEAPQPPGELALELDPAEVDHRPPLADRGQISRVLVAKGRRRGGAAKPGPDDLGDIGALLLGGWRDAWNRLPIRAKDDRRVADGENLTLSRDRQVGFNLEPSYPVRRRVEPERGGGGLNASGPDDRRRSQPFSPEHHPSGGAFRDGSAKHDLDAQPLQ